MISEPALYNHDYTTPGLQLEVVKTVLVYRNGRWLPDLYKIYNLFIALGPLWCKIENWTICLKLLQFG